MGALTQENGDTCSSIANYSGRLACPSAELPMDAFAKVAKFLGLFLIAAGLIMTLRGGKFINYVVAGVVGAAASLVVFLACYSMFLTDDVKTPTLVGVVVFSVAAGTLLSFMSYKFFKAMAVPIIAGAGGAVIALLLSKLAGVGSAKADTVFVILGVFVGLYLGKLYNVYVRSFGTALLGSFLLVRGIGCYAPGWPADLGTDIVSQQGKGIYLYFAGFVLFTILGFMFQLKDYKDDEQEENKDDAFEG